ncbi:MAG: YCF48-related protein [Saprospiraceae bacterium]
MNKLKLVFLFLIFNFNLFSQVTTFPSPGLELGTIYNCNFADACDYLTSSIFATNSDTIICGNTYQSFNNASGNLATYTRQEGGKIYYRNCQFEILLYDFDLIVGDTFHAINHNLTFSVDSITQVTLLNGDSRKSIWLHNINIPNDARQWVEGIGDINRGFTYAYDWEGGYEEFICAKDSTGWLWVGNNQVINCDSIICQYSIPDFSFHGDNQTISFEDLSEYAESWLWDFGDGNFSTDQNPIHTYNSVGCYEVKLTTSNNCSEEQVYFQKVGVDFLSPWTQVIFDDSIRIQMVDFVTPDLGWMISKQGEVYKTIDAGLTWTLQTLPPPAPNVNRYFYFVDFYNENIGMITARLNGSNPDKANILWTNDGGNTWEKRNEALSQGSGSLTYLLRAGIFDEDYAWTTGLYVDLLQSTDGGNNWENKVIDFPFIGSILEFVPFSQDTIILIGGYNPGLSTPTYRAMIGKTTDGENWEFHQFPDIPRFNSSHFINQEEGWGISNTGIITNTVDGGLSWEIQFNNPDFYFTDVFFVDNQKGWATGKKGRILHTTDGGQNWFLQFCDGPHGFDFLSFPTSDVGYASGYDAGKGVLYKYCALSSCETSSIFENPKPVASLNFQPNPFNDFTFLKFDNPNNKSHHFILTDVSGRVMLEIKDFTASELKIQSDKIIPGIYFGKLFQEEKVVGIGKIVFSQ